MIWKSMTWLHQHRYQINQMLSYWLKSCCWVPFWEMVPPSPPSCKLILAHLFVHQSPWDSVYEFGQNSMNCNFKSFLWGKLLEPISYLAIMKLGKHKEWWWKELNFVFHALSLTSSILYWKQDGFVTIDPQRKACFQQYPKSLLWIERDWKCKVENSVLSESARPW